MNINIIPIILPFFTALLIILISEKMKYLKEILTIIITFICFLSASLTLLNSYFGEIIIYSYPWLNDLSFLTLKIDMLSSFLLTSISMFSLLISIYSFSFKDKGSSKWFYFNLLMTQTLASGAVLSDSMILLLFFWEGMLIFLYTFIALSKDTKENKNAALKAFLINAITDLIMIIGVIITYSLSGTMSMAEISQSKLNLISWGTLGYVLLLIGAITKAGALPFHTWIIDASTNSSASFMAFVPAAVDKLLGIYFLARISLYLYQLNSTMQIILMTIGVLTIIIAVMMAFVQKDYKRLLSYHAVSQSGYMILGIGTLNPIGIAGGLFHMINHATYKSCLFMTAGSVEKQTGTNDIEKLGGLFSKMPITALCFLIAAAAISGIAPFNGFFSKELIYKGTLNTGYSIFFILAELGSFLTLASFLKLGHSVFFSQRKQELENTKESNLSVLLPMLFLAFICLFFGFGSYWPLEKIILPSLYQMGIYTNSHITGFHFDNLFIISIIIILLALANHILGYNLSNKKAYKASDHIHYAPILKDIYSMAEKKYFDLYEIIMKGFMKFSSFLFSIDRFFDILTDKTPTIVFNYFSEKLSISQNGSYSLYMAISFIGIIFYLLLLGGLK